MPLRALYVFTQRKQRLLDGARRGEMPDTLLFGFNHVDQYDVTPVFHEPRYGRAGGALWRAIGLLGPNAVQLRTLMQFPRHDVVFLTGAWPLLLAAQRIARPRRPKLVWLNMTLTNLIERGGPIGALVSAAARRADRIVCVAEFQRRYLHQRLGIPYERLPLALSGTDADFWASDRASPSAIPARPEQGRPIVLAAGRDAGRDYGTLARASESAPYALRLVCSERNTAGVTLPAGTHVRHDITPASLRDEYAASSVVVVPTQGERSTAGSDCSGTLVLLDSLAMGKRCVIADRESVHDYVRVPQMALTYPPGDAEALSGTLHGLMEAGDGGEPDAGAGQAHVRDHLTTRHFAARIAEVLHEVAASR